LGPRVHGTRRALVAIVAVTAFACAAGRRPPHPAGGGPPPGAIARGGATYATYCADCHGIDGAGGGPLARTLKLAAADLRTSAVASASDAALIDRLARGTPLEVPPLASPRESEAVDALATYLTRLGGMDADVLRAGKVVYDEGCAACHGTYGRAETAVAYWVGAPDLIVARERHSDAGLARISEHGMRTMPPLLGAFDRTELHVLTAYVRHLSDGFALYDTRCAACHGNDGQGIYSRDLIPPAAIAPPLGGGPYPRDRLLAMLRRERGVMPHFAEIDPRRLREVVAYLRAAVFQPADRAPTVP
jgi:mono/diheme cytochrome c family protein